MQSNRHSNPNLKKASSNKKTSSWLLLVLFLAITFSAISTKLFQAPTFLEDELANMRSPIQIDYLTDLETLELTNDLGTFRVKKNLEREVSSWDLEYPKDLPSKKSTVEAIIDTLSRIKVRKRFSYDAINEDNYSLSSPVIKITLGISNRDPLTINVGLINPIDNSTYIALGDKKYIYQVDLLKYPLEGLELGDFVNPKIFSVPRKFITKLNISRTGISTFNLFKKEENWFVSRSGKIPTENVEHYLNKLSNLTRTMILDGESEKLTKLLERYLKTPAYKIEVTDTRGEVVSYRASKVLRKSYPDFKIEKRQFFIMTASDRKYPYVVSKDMLHTLNIRANTLRKNLRKH